MDRGEPDEVPKGLRIEMGFLEGLRKRNPHDDKVLKALGNLYTQGGRYEEGLEVDELLAKLCPDESEVWYNLGCSYALAGRTEQSFDSLCKAVDLGYRDADWMKEDKDLTSLHTDPRFNNLLLRIAKTSTS